jgi:Carboxypeptidase regulatory-like domain
MNWSETVEEVVMRSYSGANFTRWFSGLLLFMFLLVGGNCYSQIVNASLSGNVTDPSGAVIPGARLIATSVATKISYTEQSDASGNYKFLSLPPGEYSLRAEKRGFKTGIMNGIVLTVAESAQVTVRLEVGSATTSVSVSGAAPLVDTTTASVGTDIAGKEILDLPLNIRHYGALALLVPGTVNDNGGFAASSLGSPFSDTTYSANGSRTASNNYLLDGIPSRGIHFGGFSLQPPPDAIQEFKVQTNIYNAAFGTVAGSTINLVTKSGSNQFHGSAYDFLRNDALDARNFFSSNRTDPVTGQMEPGTARAELRRNQFGFTLGGPIRKNKTFFFGNYEATRQVSGETQLGTVPTDVEKQGDFSSLLTGTSANLCGAGGPSNLTFDTGQLFDPATESLYTCPTGSAAAGSQILVGQPIAGNLITKIDPVAAKVLPVYPEPNLPVSTNYLNQQPSTQDTNQFDIRVDNSFGPRDQVFARYLYGRSTSVSASLVPGFNTETRFRGQNAGVGWTHTFGPSMVNEFRLGFDKSTNVIGPPAPRAAGFLAGFGINGLSAPAPNLEFYPDFSMSGFAGVGDYEYAPLNIPSKTEQLSDNLTWIHGRHSITVGTDMMSWQFLDAGGVLALAGSFAYNGGYSSLGGETNTLSAASLADFELGYPSGASHANGLLNTNQVGGKVWGYFLQDDFRVRSNLTVNAGLRWEFRELPVDKNDLFMTMAPVGAPFSGTGNALLVSALPDAENDAACTNFPYMVSASGECLIASSSERASLGYTGRTRRSLIKPNYNYFAPRFGIAWQPTGSPKYVVRSGFGVFFDMPNTNSSTFGYYNPISAPALGFNTTFGAPPTMTGGSITTTENVLGSQTVPPLINQVLGLNPFLDYVYPTVYEWSLGVESQLTQSTALDVEYIGNHGIHLDDLRRNYNQPLPGVGDLQPRRPYPDFGIINAVTLTDAISSYQALQVKVTHRFSKGLFFLGSYTWSHALDNNEGDEGFGGGVGNSTPQNNNAPLSANYANSYINVPQRLSLSYVYQLPFGRGRSFMDHGGIASAVVGGWSVSGITTFQSGFPFSVLGRDYSGTGALYTIFPDRVCNGGGDQTISSWFNTNCFTDSLLQQDLASGQPRFGNSGRNILSGPGLNIWNFVIFRDIALGERAALDLRAEAFNLFNHANFGNPNASLASPSVFGQITSARDPREIQFGARITF